MPGHCHDYKSKLHFSMQPATVFYESPETDMADTVYDAQGKLTNATHKQKYIKQFKHQCKVESPLKYADMKCPQKCDNKLYNGFLSERLLGVKYYNQ